MHQSSEVMSWTYVIVGGLALGAVVGVAIFLFRCLLLHREIHQKKLAAKARDRVAMKVAAHFRDNTPPPAFALYLRPFQSTGYQYFTAATVAAGAAAFSIAGSGQMVGSAIVQNGKDFVDVGFKLVDSRAGRIVIMLLIACGTAIIIDFILWRAYLQLRIAAKEIRSHALSKNPKVERGDVLADFEDVIESGVRQTRKLNLIALGNPGETIGGAGRLRVKDSEWQDHIRYLMKHSSFNVLVLSPRAGTLWEIEQTLSTEAWKKTLFIQPPVGGFAHGAYFPDQEYDAVREIFAKHGIAIPQRDDQGTAFAIRDFAEPPVARRKIETVGQIAGACRLVGDNMADLFTNLPLTPEAPIPMLAGINLESRVQKQE